MTERFSETLMDHFLDPRNRGTLERSDGTGVSGVPGQGPFFMIQLGCVDGVIHEARFNSHSCGVTVAAGSVLTELILNRRLVDAVFITPRDIEVALGGVPIDKRYVTESAIATLRQAIAEAQR